MPKRKHIVIHDPPTPAWEPLPDYSPAELDGILDLRDEPGIDWADFDRRHLKPRQLTLWNAEDK